MFKRIDTSNPSGCWLWTAATTGGSHTYGVLRVNGKRILAHRLAFILFNGAVADSEEVLHACDNPLCVNPAHLRLGSHADNMADRAFKDRVASRKLSPADIDYIRNSKGVQRDLAKELGVSQSTISHVKNGHVYKTFK